VFYFYLGQSHNLKYAHVYVDGTKYQVPLFIAAAIGGIAGAILVAVFADKGDHPASKMVRCSMGFFVAIVWIMAIADEVVNVLQVCTVIFQPSTILTNTCVRHLGRSLDFQMLS
jgi:solute carrier family 24 (sodium/potassium/calcium exchanger), member 6